LWEQVFSRFEIKIMSRKKLQMIRIRLFQEKEMEGGEGRSQFGGQWKVPLLGGNGRKRRSTFSLFPFSP
jgi:hypothetical protein